MREASSAIVGRNSCGAQFVVHTLIMESRDDNASHPPATRDQARLPSTTRRWQPQVTRFSNGFWFFLLRRAMQTSKLQSALQ